MNREKKVYISKVDEEGRILLPDELAKSIHSGLVDVELIDGQLLIKETAPDCEFIWTPKDK